MHAFLKKLDLNKFGALALALLLLVFATLTPLAPARAVGVGATGLNVTAGVAGTITSTDALGSTSRTLNLQQLLYLTGGTGAGAVDTFYAGSVTIAGSGTTTLDLAGSLVDSFGTTLTFGHVKFIVVVASSGNINDCQIGPGTSNPFPGPWTGTTPLTAVSPGEFLVYTKGSAASVGWTVTAATADIIKLANSAAGASVTCTLYIGGTST